MVKIVKKCLLILLIVGTFGLCTIHYKLHDVHLIHYKLDETQPGTVGNIGEAATLQTLTKMQDSRYKKTSLSYDSYNEKDENDDGSGKSTDGFMKKYSNIIKRRVNYTQEMCRKHKSVIPRMKRRPNLLVNEEHKLVYCQTPKVATVSWCKIFLTFSGFKNYSEVVKMSVDEVAAAWKKHVPHLSHFPAEKQKKIMSTYTKIMFVRNPLTRLLSAYNDLLVAKNTSTGKQLRFQHRTSKDVLTNFRPGNTSKSYDTTFRDFVKMIVSKTHYIRNIHWNNMHSVCYPCDIDYDVIGRLEDIENDSNYILKHVGAGFKFPKQTGIHFTNSSSYDKVRRSYATISDSDLQDLYQKYKYDYILFDYDKGLPRL
ncbi:carbohydrate sulfotransferase 11-like isoform X1 [Anneissia japonica]|uniref:carbohydrate sulfotransferase 11-like isoform X1 n=2 Tax=Anneissia japonica TaxID=1529436 RepID=UPI001425B3DD|nr:carbohydrate sulfotransferase 11-like isoform X1 [Anneissia japonica]